MHTNLFALGHGLLLAALSAFAAGASAAETAPTVLITGANRGIGLELARGYAERGWNVIATARRPEAASELAAIREEHPNLVIEPLDVTDFAQVDALAEKYRGRPIDVLLNNAGISGGSENQKFGALNYEVYNEVHAVNVLGPLKMAEAFAAHVAASRHKKIVSITSGAGSVSPDRVAGGGVFYGISKAALNMAMRKAGAELAQYGIIVATIAPGLVLTDMLKTNRPSLAPRARSATEAVDAMAAVIDSLDQTYDGQPRNFDGSVLPW